MIDLSKFMAEVVSLRPGDVIVISTPGTVSDYELGEINRTLRRAFPDNDAIMLERCTFKVARPL